MFWLEIATLASTCLHERQPVCFITPNEWLTHVDLVSQMPSDGLQAVVVDDVVKQKLVEQIRVGGPEVKTLESYIKIYDDSFRYTFVELSALTAQERRIYEMTDRLFDIVNIPVGQRPPVRVSETIRQNANFGGVWDLRLQQIVIKRTSLATPDLYAGTLLHEAAHAVTNTMDCTRDFENVLSTYLGMAAVAAVTRE